MRYLTLLLPLLLATTARGEQIYWIGNPHGASLPTRFELSVLDATWRGFPDFIGDYPVIAQLTVDNPDPTLAERNAGEYIWDITPANAAEFGFDWDAFQGALDARYPSAPLIPDRGAALKFFVWGTNVVTGDDTFAQYYDRPSLLLWSWDLERIEIIADDQSTVANFYGQRTRTYVPEPASMMLLLLGCLCSHRSLLRRQGN